MIEGASFRNFKSLRDVTVDFERLTVFVGPNASGKTSILDGLMLLSLSLTTSSKKLFQGRRSLRHFYRRGDYAGDMELRCHDAEAALRLRATADNTSEPLMGSGRWEATWRHKVEWKGIVGTNEEWKEIANPSNSTSRPIEARSLVSHLRSTRLLRMDAAKLAEPSYSEQSIPLLDHDGGGLSSVLAFMALNQPEEFKELQGRLRSIIPTIKGIRFNRVPVMRLETEVLTIDGQTWPRRRKRQYIGDEIILDFQGASDIPAHFASEGTLLVLGLLASLVGPFRSRLVLLDDLDHGLHPNVQRKLSPLLHTILKENPGLQIIATTHSPYIIDELDPREVRVTWANEDGVTICNRLDQHPDLDRWRGELWPGEFWSLVGEQWVATGLRREGQ